MSSKDTTSLSVSGAKRFIFLVSSDSCSGSPSSIVFHAPQDGHFPYHFTVL